MVAQLWLTLLGGGFAVSLALTLLYVAVLSRWRVYAQPNARSFHHRTTLTAGGVAFVVPVVAYLAWVASAGSMVAGALAVGSLLLAAVGLLDDVRHVPAALRLVLQGAVAVAIAMLILGEPTAAAPPDHRLGVALPGGLLVVVAAAGLVWYTNLYNFMDGIDGLAAAQALLFAVGVHVVGLGVPGWAGDLLWLLAGSVLGFLILNWPPARVFMGNVGSYFLGVVTGATALLLWHTGVLAWPVLLILLAWFWFDATYTLIVRASTVQAVTQAHRSHLYQKLAARHGHFRTTVGFLGYGVVWLIPLAWLCRQHGTDSLLGGLAWLLPAVTPLALAAVRLRAGLPDDAPVR